MARSSKNSLRKLSRLQLLELLAQQERELDSLRRQLQEQEVLLEERQIIIEESGSIAEAALRLNGIFEAAQRAADQYLHSIKAPDFGDRIRKQGVEDEA